MADQTSIWKKEIRLGRRPRLEEAVGEAMHAPETAPEQSEEKQSLWKKESHIVGTRKDASAAPDAPAETTVSEPQLESPAVHEHPQPAVVPSAIELEPLVAAPEPPPQLATAAPVPSGPVVTVPPLEPQPEFLAPEPLPQPVPSDPAPPSVAVGPPEPQPVVTVPAPSAEPALVSPQPSPPPVFPPAPQPVGLAPAPPSDPPAHLKQLFAPRVDKTLEEIDAGLEAAKAAVAAALAKQAAVAQDPIAALRAAASEATTAGRRPFWERERRLGRGTRPKAARVAKQRKQPIWKRELSLGRGSKPKVEVEQAPKQSSQRFWKKAVSLRRGPKPEAEVPSQPFWRKELGRGSKPKPQAKSAQEREAGTAPKQPGQPFWKKELSLGGGSKPKPRSMPKQSQLERSGSGAVEIGGRAAPLENVVGLRIGSSQLAAALVHNNGSAELLQLARTPLEAGVVAGGEVRDAEALSQALRRFFAENKLPRSGVRLGVATGRIGVRVLEVPVMEDPKLLANAIRFRAQEVLPIPLGDAVLDHVVLGEATSQDGERFQRVLLVFAHRELVDGYLDACNRAGLKLVGIDFDAFALLRALSDKIDDGPEKKVALVAVAIGRERTIFAVSDGSICDFARVLEWGGGSLDAAVAAALSIEPAEAEKVKRSLSLAGDAIPGGPSGTELEASRAALREELQVLARELVSSLQFYQSRPESLDIGEVLLTGGGAQLAGIDAELSRQLGVPVRMGDPLRRVTLGKSVVPPPEAGSLTIAVGLGIEG